MSPKQDVLEILSDPVLSKLNFFVGDVHIASRLYMKVGILIEEEDIVVERGNEAGKAKYNMSGNRLITQPDPLSSHDQRGLIIHECTHAFIDIDQLRVSRLTSEAAAYLAQVTYLLLKNPAYTAPGQGFFADFVALAKKHDLHKSPNPPPKVNDYESIATKLKEHDDYKDKDLSDEVPADGVDRHLSDEQDPYNHIGPRRQVAMDDYPHLSEANLIRTLKRRYAKNDVAGYVARVRELESDFGHLTKENAKSLHARLLIRKKGDRASRYFHDHLSTPTRARLLNILYSRS
jgi:hypothetical protein